MTQYTQPSRRGTAAGGGAVFDFGPADNVFGTASNNGFTGATAAASRTAAEGVRDAYQAANPSWIDDYTDLPVNIALYYTVSGTSFVQYQRRIGSEWVDHNNAVTAIRGANGTDGDNGWTPSFAVVSDSERRVLQIVDWVGGEGTKPATGSYVGATGLVTDIAQAVDIRGATGATGTQGPAGADGSDGVGIQSITSTQSNTTITVTVTLTDNTTRTFSFTSDGGAPSTPTNQYKVFTQVSSTVTEQDITSVTEEGTSLPYRVVLSEPQDNLVVAWHSTTEVTDIHINILEASEDADDIITSPLGNRFLRSAVQVVGNFEYQVIDISADRALLTAGQKLGVYVG